MGFKDHEENSPEGKQARKDAQASDTTLAEVQKQADKEAEQGFRGVSADPTPNENYTLQGVLAGKPTPETDKAHAREVRNHLDDVAARSEGVARNNG